MFAREGSCHLGEALPPKMAGGDALERIDERGGGDPGWHWHLQVQMIGFAVKLVERAAESGADLPEDAAKERAHAGRDRPAAVFCHKDQMIIEAIDDTSSSTKRGFHRN